MKVKIDTKEKMHVITIEEEKLSVNMTEELKSSLLKYLSAPINNVVLNLEHVSAIELSPANMLVSIQQAFYDANHSLVFCHLQPAVSDFLDKNDLLEGMNITPTESEAWDIVQMEEIEREYL
jgi:anti-anti-sigma factor